jgi:hypothetical protein
LQFTLRTESITTWVLNEFAILCNEIIFGTKFVSLYYSVNTLGSRSTALTQLSFHAVPHVALQSLAAVTNITIHIGEIDNVAIRVSHAGVNWVVVWATRVAFCKQTDTHSNAVRTSTCYMGENMWFVKAKSEYF